MTAHARLVPFGLWHTLNAKGAGLDHLRDSQSSRIEFVRPKMKVPTFKCNSVHLTINSQMICNYTAEQKNPTSETVELPPRDLSEVKEGNRRHRLDATAVTSLVSVEGEPRTSGPRLCSSVHTSLCSSSTCLLTHKSKMASPAQACAAQWVGPHPEKRTVPGSIPSQGTYLGSGPTLGATPRKGLVRN